MDSDIPLTISAVVTTHWPSVGIWHWAWAASYVKPLDFWASTGQCVLCTCIWLFCFPGPIADWFPASPLVSLRGSDEHGINLLFSFLTPIKLKINTPSQNTKEAQEKSASMWGACTLLHIIISGTWDSFPIQMTQLQGKSEFFSRVHPNSINVSKWNHLLKLPPEALHSTEWERKHFRHAH